MSPAPHLVRILGGAAAAAAVEAAYSNLKSLLHDGVDEHVLVSKANDLDTAFDGDHAFSLSFWIKPTAVTYRSILGNCDGGELKGYHCFTHPTQIGMYFGNSYSTGDYLNARSANPITAGVWTHICITYSGSRLLSGFKIYFDGVSQTVSAGDPGSGFVGSGVSTADWRIGDSLSPYNDPYYGGLDTVLIYNTELSAAQAAALAVAATDPTSLDSYSSALRYWRMGDGDTYPTIIDQKGNGNGTMTNMESGDIVSDAPA